ncbi:MAG: HD domain-containing protein [Trueperaceae bacterium]|nr:HD domain-containing protein [Trueperaceae bacterium]
MNIGPNLAQAETFLAEAECLNPGPWVAHSRNVALAAQKIAQFHPELDEDLAYVFGLLHDIGRREGVTGMRHTLDGFHFLMHRGFPEAARICLTHSFSYKSMDAALGRWDVSDEEFDFIRSYLTLINFGPYDMLFQLCDAIALAEGICLMEKRLVDAAIRLGTNDFTHKKWQALFDIKAYFEGYIGKSIYAVLPNVIDTTFREIMQ